MDSSDESPELPCFAYIVWIIDTSLPETDPEREFVHVYRVEAPGLFHAHFWGEVVVKSWVAEDPTLEFKYAEVRMPHSWSKELPPLESFQLIEFDAEAFVELGILEYREAYGEDAEREFFEMFGGGDSEDELPPPGPFDPGGDD